MKAPARIEVKWADAHRLREEQELTAEEAIERAHSPLITTTAGYLVKSDSAGITIATEWQANEDTVTFRDIAFIPRAMVLKEQMPRKRKKLPSSSTVERLTLTQTDVGANPTSAAKDTRDASDFGVAL